MVSRSGFVRIFSSVCLAAVCVSGFCADTNDPASSASGASDPAQPVLPQSGSGSDRVLSVNDLIKMTVYQEDDLETKTTIDKNGMVMLPLLGQMKLAGLTVGQATARIQELYNKDYLVNPRVNLIVDQFADRHFSVLGQVQKPGSFDFPQNEPVNLLEAIAIAGGYTRLGSPAKVSVRRIENGSPKVYFLDAGKMAKDPKNNPFEILPDDIINVGERSI
jgi:protein involved in polysaccharide export with SLBB domain